MSDVIESAVAETHEGCGRFRRFLITSITNPVNRRELRVCGRKDIFEYFARTPSSEEFFSFFFRFSVFFFFLSLVLLGFKTQATWYPVLLRPVQDLSRFLLTFLFSTTSHSPSRVRRRALML